MSCPDVRLRLDDYVDDELSPAERLGIESHLSECPSCRAELDALLSLLRTARSLPSALPPGRDLWPVIEAEIRPSVVAGPWRRTPLRLVAAAAALVAVTASVTWLAARSSIAPQTAPTLQTADVTLETADVEVDPAPQRYPVRAALNGVHARSVLRQDVLDAFAVRRDELPPETIAVVEANLATIESALAEIGEALGVDPTNRELQLRLASTRAREVEILSRMRSLLET